LDFRYNKKVKELKEERIGPGDIDLSGTMDMIKFFNMR